MMTYALAQGAYADIHDNSTGMTQSWNCGFVNPALLGCMQHRHYGCSIVPSPYGIPEFTHYGICGEIPIDTSLVNTHGSTEYMSIQDLSILTINVASAWKGHDLPFLAGVTMKSEFASFGDGILHCLQVDIGLGGVLIIDEHSRISSVLRTPLAFPSSQRIYDVNSPMLIIGVGVLPIDDVAFDVDMVSSAFGSGLRPKLKFVLPNQTEIQAGFSNLHRSAMLGISTLQESISLKVDIFYHLNLGFSWQFELQYMI
ncbi:MAG: hypothetical protein ACK5GO_02100 [Ignavibacteria bacterium]|jgi:hypothetical protein